MTLPQDFLFNQSNLQDYVDCQRRFQLRYLLHQSWPAVEAEPFLEFERMMNQGSQFHKIVHQHLTGIPESQIEESLGGDLTMDGWWNNYEQSLNDGVLEQILQKGMKRYVELSLSIPMGEYRLIAKYDLLVLTPDGRFLIFDWKTSKIYPKRKWLSDRLQTHVYPYVLTHAMDSIAGSGLTDPSKVEMVYWFTNQPEKPMRFRYNDTAFDADKKFLVNLLPEITQRTDPVFPLTPEVKRCQFCIYRSLCNRGVKPGEIHELEEWQMTEPDSEEVLLDYEQIGEIEY